MKSWIFFSNIRLPDFSLIIQFLHNNGSNSLSSKFLGFFCILARQNLTILWIWLLGEQESEESLEFGNENLFMWKIYHMTEVLLWLRSKLQLDCNWLYFKKIPNILLTKIYSTHLDKLLMARPIYPTSFDFVTFKSVIDWFSWWIRQFEEKIFTLSILTFCKEVWK